MNSRERMLAALNRKMPDRLPVTTHHLMPYFLNKYLPGTTNEKFFKKFGFDPIVWTTPHKPGDNSREYFDPEHKEPGFLESRRIFSENWRIESEQLYHSNYKTVRYNFITPGGKLSMVLQSNDYTSWVSEYLIKNKNDIDLIESFVTHPRCDVQEVNRVASDNPDSLIRGHICIFDIYGQPGCWQDAACLVGTEKLIMETVDDPKWVHHLLKVLQERKITYINSLKNAQYDLLELGGGSASTTVISPKIFEQFVFPYDSRLIEFAHEAGQKIVYHTCGGMMPILRNILEMRPDAMETFTPAGMGGDADLGKAKKILDKEVCMIGGFDQFHFFKDCSPEDTRREVRRCFKEAGAGGAYILCPSDHFFDADLNLLTAFTDEAAKCLY